MSPTGKIVTVMVVTGIPIMIQDAKIMEIAVRIKDTLQTQLVAFVVEVSSQP